MEKPSPKRLTKDEWLQVRAEWDSGLLSISEIARQFGLDLTKGTCRNNIEAGVVEPALSKLKIVQFATEAAITILRIDDLIRLAPEESEGGED